MYGFGLEHVVLKWALADVPDEGPEFRGSVTVYARKRRYRWLMGFGSLLFLTMTAGSVYYVLAGDQDRIFKVGIPFGLAAFFLALTQVFAEVAVDGSGIRKTVLGYTRQLEWREIRQVQWKAERSLHLGAEANPSIVLLADGKKMKIENSYVGLGRLLEEIQRWTQLRPDVKIT